MTDILPHLSKLDLFDLAQREPERLRKRLDEGPPRAERSRLESALFAADCLERSRAKTAHLLENPVRWQAAMKFWAEMDEAPDQTVH